MMRLFERAYWEVLDRGQGIEAFEHTGSRSALRKATLECYESVAAGDILDFDTALTHHGETSFTVHQTARRGEGGAVVAEADFVYVAVDRAGTPRSVPSEIARIFGRRPSGRPGETQHFRVRGSPIAVDIQGDGPGLLFVHGFPLDRTMWRHLMATLTGWRRVAPDLKGMGLSDLGEDRPSMASYADDLADLLRALEIDSAVVCGVSMGGYVAFEMMRRHRGFVRALVLVNTRAEADDEAAKRRRDDMRALIERDGTDALADELVPKLLGSTTLSSMPHVVDDVRSMVGGNAPAGLAAALAAMRDRPDSTPLLETIEVPTLVVAGSDDQLISVKEARAVSSAIADSQFTLIPQAGHLTPLEQPIAVSRVIGEFIEALG